jgi:NAD-dependent dihydropyrimidine dehydrogenase PreA subunit
VIEMVNGKAVAVRIGDCIECGACIGACEAGAIEME